MFEFFENPKKRTVLHLNNNNTIYIKDFISNNKTCFIKNQDKKGKLN